MLRPAMKAKQAGFTLIELMFTIVVLAVLLGIGVPNFRDFVRNSRLTSAANDLLTDVNLARSEAVKRRVPVTLCKSANGSSCDTSATSPFRRWIVFVDDADPAANVADDGDGEVDGSEPILKDRTVSATLTAPAAGRRLIYQPSGFPVADGANRLTRLLFCDARGSAISVGGVSAARGVTVSATGRAAVTRDKAVIEATVASGGFGGCP
jgi:type IV fimbrial biogenesis protein FimT